MGYATLDAALAFQNNVPPINTHIAITDCLKSDGNFLIHHFVVNQLKANKPVILVGLAQIFNHYFLIGRKLVSKPLFYFIYIKKTPSLTYTPYRVSTCKHINKQVNFYLSMV